MAVFFRAFPSMSHKNLFALVIVKPRVLISPLKLRASPLAGSICFILGLTNQVFNFRCYKTSYYNERKQKPPINRWFLLKIQYRHKLVSQS